MTNKGSVAIAIYNNSQLDLVPWELLIKIFRSHLGDTSFNKLEEYGPAFFDFLKNNNALFPTEILDGWIKHQFYNSILAIFNEIDRSAFDQDVDIELRKSAYERSIRYIEHLIDTSAIFNGLSKEPLEETLKNIPLWADLASTVLNDYPTLSFASPSELAVLALKTRYIYPNLILPYTGIVITGYGDEQIFPGYHQYLVYGHIGRELAYEEKERKDITHGNVATIKPLAQSSMIEMFTTGFSNSLAEVIERQATAALDLMMIDLKSKVADIPDDFANETLKHGIQSFMENWKKIYSDQNFQPLINVVQSLSVPEMAHLAESLLGLQSLKERVTSPSETVGGPIDVAAITKTEGLIWIKRKHFFDPALNMRYAKRLDKIYCKDD